MKLFLVIASALLLAASAIGENPRESRMRSRSLYSEGDDNSAEANQIRQPSILPDWVNEMYPDAADILMYTKKTISGLPAQKAATSIINLCNSAIFYRYLKPSYVPLAYKINLRLYSPNNVTEYSLNTIDRIWSDPNFDQKKNLTVFFSDWQEDKNDPESMESILANAYLKRGTHTFIAVNVGDFVNNLYKWAVFDSKQAGALIGEALDHLTQGFRVERVHLIGHGLGAHIAGAVGRHEQRLTNNPFGRITALDPSRLCSYGAYSLQRGDGAFVDVIHSNNGVLGKIEPIGDADFYPNGPVVLQPGSVDVVSAHNLAVRYYVESVEAGSENNFMAVHCTSLEDMKNNKCQGPKIPMGFNTPSDARGSYYLQTNSRPPYGEVATGDKQANSYIYW